jgi:hypothetical protein
MDLQKADMVPESFSSPHYMSPVALVTLPVSVLSLLFLMPDFSKSSESAMQQNFESLTYFCYPNVNYVFNKEACKSLLTSQVKYFEQDTLAISSSELRYIKGIGPLTVLCLKYNSGWTPFTENKLLWASV